MTFNPIVSTIPPTPGNSKMLWSPELFDSATGDYPKAVIPSIVTYPKFGSSMQYFDHSEEETVSGTGYIQVDMPDILATIPSGGYWSGVANIYKIIDAWTTIHIGSVVMKGSQMYTFIPALLPPLYHDYCTSIIEYTDSVGNQKFGPVPAGEYHVVLGSCYVYNELTPVQNPPAGDGRGIAATFGSTTPDIPYQNLTADVSDASTTLVSFSIA